MDVFGTGCNVVFWHLIPGGGGGGGFTPGLKRSCMNICKRTGIVISQESVADLSKNILEVSIIVTGRFCKNCCKMQRSLKYKTEV